jgi:replicative DNA helicase
MTDATAKSGYVACRLADLAREHEVCILMLLQPQKSAGDAREPLRSMRKIKGASIIEQDCRVILTLWRPGFKTETTEDDRYAVLGVVKNNMGSIGEFPFNWDGPRGVVTELSQTEKEQYKALVARIEEEKRQQEERNGF